EDGILWVLAGNGGRANRFLVGDPKQSIYRFRLADPRIFRGYLEQWQDQPDAGQVIALTENFRSRESIVRFINTFFGGLMTREMGGIEYDEMARLHFGDRAGRVPFSAAADGETSSNQAAEGLPLAAVELHLRLAGGSAHADAAENDGTDSNGGSLDSLSQAEVEARLIGLRLAQLRTAKAQV